MTHTDLLLTAINYFDNNNFEMSLSLLNKIIEEAPENTDALYYRSMVYQQNAQFSDAMNDLIKVLEFNPSDSRAETALKMLQDILGYRYVQRYNV